MCSLCTSHDALKKKGHIQHCILQHSVINSVFACQEFCVDYKTKDYGNTKNPQENHVL